MSGAPEGASRPPSGSSVTATICPGSTCRVSSATPGSLEEPRPLRDAVLEDPDLVVLPGGRGGELPHDERGVPVRRHDEVGLPAVAPEGARVRVAEHGELALGSVEVARERRRPDAEPDRRHRCDGRDRGQCRDEEAGPPQRHDVRPLAARLLEDPSAQRRGRHRPAGRVRERAGDLPEALELLAAALARGEMLLEGLALRRVERVERVAGGQLVNVHEFLSASSSRSCRKRDRPANILLLIVPSGSPSRSASSDWV